MLAIDILKWPGMNAAFLTSLIVTLGLTFAVIPYGKRRPIGTPVSWGEAMLGAFYAFGVLLLGNFFFWTILTQSDVFIAARYLSPHQLGLYAEALFLTTIIAGSRT